LNCDPDEDHHNQNYQDKNRLFLPSTRALIRVVVGLPEFGLVEMREESRPENALVVSFVKPVTGATHPFFRSPDEKSAQHGETLKEFPSN